jgi:hypothetical protein
MRQIRSVARGGACALVLASMAGCSFDHTFYSYDADGDGVPDAQMPSCTTLSATAFNFSATVSDAEYWGCVAR